MSVNITRTNIGEYVTRFDLEKRWSCDRPAIRELIERHILPEPLTVVNCGGHYIWPLETILSIEADSTKMALMEYWSMPPWQRPPDRCVTQ